MKYLIAIGAIASMLTISTMPAFAIYCPQSSDHSANNFVPPICAVADTKEKHPGWFRDGGYCAGASDTAEVTGSGHYNCPKLPFPWF